MKPSLAHWTLNCIDTNKAEVEPPLDIRKEINGIQGLPPLPGIAAKIMKLASDPLADTNKLSEIIELDPLLSSQVIRWASSALYAYQGKISNVKDAINRVLGYQFVFNLVLSLAMLSPLKVPSKGIIGTQSFWIHALASTLLMKEINDFLPKERKVDPQTLFLIALMHNVGILLLGDQFIEKFNQLSEMIEANPNLNRVKLEKFAFGVDHCELGSWLLDSWAMPQSVIDVVYHHHNPFYQGESVQLNLITYLNDILLAKINIGDGYDNGSYNQVLEQLQISSFDAEECLEKIVAELDSINAMINICTNTT